MQEEPLKESEKDFLKPHTDILNSQNVETNKSLIEVHLSIEEKNWSKVFKNSEILSESDIEALNKNPEWIQYCEDREQAKILSEALFGIIREEKTDYRSTLLESIKSDPDLYFNKLVELTKGAGVSEEKIKSFLEENSTPESIKKAENGEKKNLKDNINTAKLFEDPSAILALQGYRNQEEGITEKTGKHIVNSGFSVSAELSNYVAENKVYQFYSPLIKDMVQEVSGNDPRITLPDKMLVLDAIKDKLPDKDFSLLKDTAERSYIEYYFERSLTDEVSNQQEYLNSKGINIEKTDTGIKLNLVNESNNFIEKESSLEPDLNLQESILNECGKGNEEQAHVHRKIHILLENENYIGAAFELKNHNLTEKDIFFTRTDKQGFQELADNRVLNEAIFAVMKEEKTDYRSTLLVVSPHPGQK